MAKGRIILEGVISPGKLLNIDGWKEKIISEHGAEDKHGKKKSVEFQDMNDENGEYNHTVFFVYEE